MKVIDKENKFKFYTGKTNIPEKQTLEDAKKDIVRIFSSSHLSFLLGAGCSTPAIPSMKEIFDKVKPQIEKMDMDEEIKKDKNLEKVLEVLFAKKFYLERTKNKQEEILKETIEYIKEIKKLIFDCCIYKDTCKKSIDVECIYKKFYRKLMYRESSLSKINIFTTNYDLFNEKAMDDLGIIYCNGFSGNINRYFNPMTFNYAYAEQIGLSNEKYNTLDKYIYFYKLHGSINWIEEQNSDKLFKIREIQNSTLDDNNLMIYPTPTKQSSSFSSPYSDLFRDFQKKLLIQDSALVVIGYSFSDEHINNIIYQALATVAKFRLIIFSYGEVDKNEEIKKLKDFHDPRIWILEGKIEESNIAAFQYIVDNFLLEINEDDEKLEKTMGQYKNDTR